MSKNNAMVNFKVGKYLCDFKNPDTYVEMMKNMTLTSMSNSKIDLRIWFYGDTHVEFLNKTPVEVNHEIDNVVEKIKNFPIAMKEFIVDDWKTNCMLN